MKCLVVIYTRDTRKFICWTETKQQQRQQQRRRRRSHKQHKYLFSVWYRNISSWIITDAGKWHGYGLYTHLRGLILKQMCTTGNYMEKSPSWEVGSRSACQQLYFMDWRIIAIYTRLQNDDPIPSHMNPVHTPKSYIFTIHFHSPYLYLVSQGISSLKVFDYNFAYAFPNPPVYVTCPDFLFALDSITLIGFYYE